MRETGRFAPSPTGPLHAGSLVAALASWLDVRARGPKARWLVRIEDADTERCLPGMGEHMLRQLADCHLLPDETPVWQTQRTAHYEAALQKLQALGLAYPCGCSRKDIDTALARLGHRHERHGERVYPGTCRDGLHGKPARAWRFATEKFESNQPANSAGPTGAWASNARTSAARSATSCCAAPMAPGPISSPWSSTTRSKA
jgi:glutamyl-Q tRNA(Asp) synthetase